MNVSLQDIRNLGYKKINQNFCKNTLVEVDSKLSFFNNAKELSAVLSTFKMPAYSLMNYWGSIKNVCDIEVRGVKALMLYVEPLLSSLNEPSNAVKRKFRNTWDTIWSKYGEVNKLNISELELLKDLGLKIPIFLASYLIGDAKASKVVKDIDVPVDLCNILFDDMCSFYNSVLLWFIFTQSESDLVIRDISLLDILDILTVNDSLTFVSKLEDGSIGNLGGV